MASTGEAALWRLGHRPALDGVRGIALLFVLCGHLWIPGFMNGGPVGVTAFFTLSGFLITSLLLEEHADRGRISLRRFYVRRLRRLAPAQLVCVVVVSVAGLGLWFALGARFVTPGQSLSAALYLTNMTAPHVAALGHFWSLAVEEQFYLLWAPAVALMAWRGFGRRGVIVLAALGIVTAIVLRALWMDGPFEASLPLRGDGLLVGCLAAALLHGRRESAGRPRLALVALAGLLVLGGLLPYDPLRSWDLTLVAVSTAVLIWSVAQGTSSRWLSNRTLIWVGKRSYALYLWHWPIRYAVASAGVTSWVVLTLAVVPLSVALAEASWRYVESPFRARPESTDEPSGPQEGERGPGLANVASGRRVADL